MGPSASRVPDNTYDARVLQPELQQAFDKAKQLYLSRFAAADLGYAVVQFYILNEFWVGLGTKEGLRQQKVSQRSHSDLEVVSLVGNPEEPVPRANEVSVGAADPEQVLVHDPQDFPRGAELVEIAEQCRLVHLDGSTTDFFSPNAALAEHAGQFVSMEAADDSPTPILQDFHAMAQLLTPDIHETIESFNFDGLEEAGRIVVAYDHNVDIVPKYLDLSA